MNLHDRIKEERERLGYNQTAFAALAGATKHSQINWEKGVAFPNAAVLAAWAEVGLDVAYVVTGERSRPVPPKYTPPPDEEDLLNAYRTSTDEVKAVIRAASLAAAKAARGSVPASIRRKTS